MTEAGPLTPAGGDAAGERDLFIDFLRAVSLLIVVVFHWVFTILEFDEHGVSATNPIGSTRGIWLLTWVLQVVPLFFFVGGYVDWRLWDRFRRRGGRWWGFVADRWRRLLVPALGVVLAWVGVGVVVALLRGAAFAVSAVLLIVSPLWFLGVYALLVVTTPVAVAVHRRWGQRVVIALVLAAMGLDFLRFGFGMQWAGWLNLVLIWSFCHQMGMHWGALVGSRRSARWLLFGGGVMALLLLTTLASYPGSMVGVSGEVSNVAPPTLPMAALLLVQVGLALMLRERVLHRMRTSPRWQRLGALAQRFSLPLYLLHTTAFAVALGIAYLVIRYDATGPSTPGWWIERPMWVVFPALVAVPIVVVGQRVLGGGSRRGVVEESEHDAVKEL